MDGALTENVCPVHVVVCLQVVGHKDVTAVKRWPAYVDPETCTYCKDVCRTSVGQSYLFT